MELLNILVKEVDTDVAFAQSGAGASVDISGCQTVGYQAICTVADIHTFTSGNVDTTAETITITAHGYATGLNLEVSGGTPPAPLAASTEYFVIKVDANTIKLATSLVNANAGTAINLTTTGTGGPFTLTPVTADIDVVLQQSVDDSTWFDSDTEAVTADKNILFALTNPIGRYARLAVTVTDGQLTLASRVLGKGVV